MPRHTVGRNARCLVVYFRLRRSPARAATRSPRRWWAFRPLDSRRSRGTRRELEGQPVHAIAQAGRLWPVVENVAQVATATVAQHLGAPHAQREVTLLVDDALRQRLVKARPTRAALEFG